MRNINPKSFFSSEEKERITSAIKEAECNTSGEIRLFVENKCAGAVLDRAAFWFAKLNMTKTAMRNGVLFYLALTDKKFAILGDVGINAKVPDNFWEDISTEMANSFKENAFTEGIVTGILNAGGKLKEHFPYQQDDKNELSDEISFGK